ncbi:MAG: hypothetical protein L0H78_09770 [Humibacillus sp.]|nr:hypothetical protein [Humibacillus sp.]
MNRMTRTHVRALTAARRRPGPQPDPDAGNTTTEWAVLSGVVALVVLGLIVLGRWLLT